MSKFLNKIAVCSFIVLLQFVLGDKAIGGMSVDVLPKFKFSISHYYKVPFDNPQSITIDNEYGELYVVDTGSSEIVIFDLKGTPISKLGKSSGINKPLDIVIRKDRYYISQQGKSYVDIFDFLGNSVGKLSVEGQEFSPGMLFNRDGNLYVINKVINELVVFDSEDKFLRTIGTGDVRLRSLTGAAIGSDKVYLFTPFNLSRGIHVYSIEGEYSHSFESVSGSGGGGSLGVPIRGIVDESNNLWIVDALRGILVYNSDDKKVNSFGYLEKNGKRKVLEYPIDIDFGSQNEVYILEETTKQISIFR